jgi:hypothetical protein
LKINDIPTHVKGIQWLILVNTHLETLQASVFDSVLHLLHLNLSNNLLRTLDYNLFSNLIELRILDLTNNKLNSLHDERLFKSQAKLLQLLLANNELTTLDISVLNPLISINSLVLTGNKFNCNCQLRLVMIWCGNRGLDADVTCEYPSKYKGHSWSVTNSSEICAVTETTNKVSLNEYVPTTARDVAERAVDEWHSGTSMAVQTVYVCVPVLLLCVAAFTVAACWRKFKRSTARQDKGDSIKLETNLGDENYYTDIELSQNMAPLSLPPVPPKRMSTNKISSKGQGQRGTEPETYDYVDFDSEHQDTVTVSECCSSSGKSSKTHEAPPEDTSHTAEQLGTEMLHRNSLYVVSIISFDVHN